MNILFLISDKTQYDVCKSSNSTLPTNSSFQVVSRGSSALHCSCLIYAIPAAADEFSQGSISIKYIHTSGDRYDCKSSIEVESRVGSVKNKTNCLRRWAESTPIYRSTVRSVLISVWRFQMRG